MKVRIDANPPTDEAREATFEDGGAYLGGQDPDEDREQWKANSAVALTASPELTDAHPTGTETLQAFQTLTDAASSQYDPAQDAQEGGYSQLPEILT